MFIDKLSVKNLRNISKADLQLNKKTNIIIGENAAGKTTLLESIDILSRGKSFRTNKTENLVKSGQEAFYVGATLGDSKRKLEIEKGKSRTRIIIDNKEERNKAANVIIKVMDLISPGPKHNSNSEEHLQTFSYPQNRN